MSKHFWLGAALVAALLVICRPVGAWAGSGRPPPEWSGPHRWCAAQQPGSVPLMGYVDEEGKLVIACGDAQSHHATAEDADAWCKRVNGPEDSLAFMASSGLFWCKSGIEAGQREALPTPRHGANANPAGVIRVVGETPPCRIGHECAATELNLSLLWQDRQCQVQELRLHHDLVDEATGHYRCVDPKADPSSVRRDPTISEEEARTICRVIYGGWLEGYGMERAYEVPGFGNDQTPPRTVLMFQCVYPVAPPLEALPKGT